MVQLSVIDCSIVIIMLLKLVELNKEHDEWSKVVEEADVPHSDQLEIEAKELQVAVAGTWVFHMLGCFDVWVFLIFSGILFSWKFKLHISVESYSQFLTRGSLDWVRIEGIGEHVIEIGNGSQ